MFVRITRTATTQVRASWCHWCLTTHGPRMCKPLALWMAEPGKDELPPQPGPPVKGLDYPDPKPAPVDQDGTPTEGDYY
jgi:hypothetical protein